MCKELQHIQQALVAKKDKYNDFGKFPYRSAESILEALKPHLAEHKCSVVLSDDLVMLGDRFYVKATASLVNENGVAIASANAFAREAVSKSGSDVAQLTGGASSYARKYALCGLFAVDDSREDPDTKDNRNTNNGNNANEQKGGSRGDGKKPTPKPTITEGCDKWEACIDYCAKNNKRAEDLLGMYTIDERTCKAINAILDLRNELNNESF